MKSVAVESLRRVEADLIARYPGLGNRLMEQAGTAVASLIQNLLHALNPPADASVPLVRFLAGSGNNGGDAYVAARILAEQQIPVDVWVAAPMEKIHGGAKQALEALQEDGDVAIRWCAAETAWTADEEELPPVILVDALLGTGATGNPRGIIAAAIRYIQAHRDNSLVVSIDLPSGLDADTGIPNDPVVVADYTLTMGYPKRGMLNPAAVECLGTLLVEPFHTLEKFSDWELPVDSAAPVFLAEQDVRHLIHRRRRNTHKGTYGHILLTGGAEYPGAITLAAAAAARSGVGLVHVATVGSSVQSVLTRTPEAIVADDLFEPFALDGYQAILLGPGLGRTPEARRVVLRLLNEAQCPLILDADAITVLAGHPEIIKTCRQPVVLTPHPGELAALLGMTVEDVQRDRFMVAEAAAEQTGAIVVLKGAGTLIAQTGRPTACNLNGNPGMACGGSGDVLGGLMCGWMARLDEAFDAAGLAVWLHGRAGDLAALQLSPHAMNAGDVIDHISAALKTLRAF